MEGLRFGWCVVFRFLLAQVVVVVAGWLVEGYLLSLAICLCVCVRVFEVCARVCVRARVDTHLHE